MNCKVNMPRWHSKDTWTRAWAKTEPMKVILKLLINFILSRGRENHVTRACLTLGAFKLSRLCNPIPPLWIVLRWWKWWKACSKYQGRKSGIGIFTQVFPLRPHGSRLDATCWRKKAGLSGRALWNAPFNSLIRLRRWSKGPRTNEIREFSDRIFTRCFLQQNSRTQLHCDEPCATSRAGSGAG